MLLWLLHCSASEYPHSLHSYVAAAFFAGGVVAVGTAVVAVVLSTVGGDLMADELGARLVAFPAAVVTFVLAFTASAAAPAAAPAATPTAALALAPTDTEDERGLSGVKPTF